MELISFDDTCTILRDRSTGEYDEYDNPIRDVIYEGPCNYQEGGVNTFGIISRRPTLYIPENDILICINDIVQIKTWSGREIESLVSIPRDVRLSINTLVKVTRLELKQAIGD